ncbi:hypothetical protein MVEG_10365 [Podila verticillata NRRL 6337]|nr:hypothetical protein MVEG_10365 [Podila verticillata NRRL 6337]
MRPHSTGGSPTAALLLTLLTLASTVAASTKITDLLYSDPGFSILVRHLQATRLIPYLNNHCKTCTFFAPTNAAFNQWREEHGIKKVDAETLLYHILPEAHESQTLKDTMLLETALVREGYLGDNHEGQLVAVSKPSWRPGRRNKLLVGGSELIKVDWIADNGVVHVIDRLLAPPEDLVKTMKKHAELEALYNIVHGAGLDTLLTEHRPFTVFAPTGGALQKLNEIQVQYLKHPEGRQDLTVTFQHHIHSGTLYKHDIPLGATVVSTLEGQDLMVYLDEKLLVDNAEVDSTDILASNGVIHTVVRPLLPSSLVWTAGKYLIGMNATSFVHHLRDAGLSHYIDTSEGSYTIFAPKDDISGDIEMMAGAEPSDVLKYHVVPGKRLLPSFQDGLLLDTELHTEELNGLAQKSKVSIKQDRKRSTVSINGVEIIGEPVQVGKSIIYLLNKPMDLPLPLVKTIKQKAALSGYVDALTATSLGRRLSDARGVTVFAPSSQAWSDLGVVEDYLRLQQEESLQALENVVRYTVVESVHYAGDFKSGRSVLRTNEGSELVVEKNGETIYVGEGRLERSERVGGKVVGKDLLVEAGVVHTVSSVALPPTLSITLYNVLQGAGTKSFLRAFQNSNITRILTDWEQDFTIFAPTDEAFEKADLEGALNDIDFVARLIRLHVIPGRILKLEEDVNEEGASMLNQDARLTLRDIHGNGKSYGVRVKGARSKKEARIVDFGSAHPAWPKDDEESWARGRPGMREQNSGGLTQDMSQRVQSGPRPGGVVFVIDRVLLPGDPDPLSGAWFWICVVLLALLGTTAVCALTALGLHALVIELRELENRAEYEAVPARDSDEEAAVGRRGEDPEAPPPSDVVVDTPAPVAATEAPVTATEAPQPVAEAPEVTVTNEDRQ